MQKFFETRNGRVVTDERFSEKLYRIKELHPEHRSEEDSGYEWNDFGIAELFGELYRDEVRYCIQYKSWYTYSKGAWRKDEGSLLAAEKLKELVRMLIIYCGDIEDDDIREKYTTFVNKMGDRRMRERILKDSTGVMGIDATEFDVNPYLINCQNGVYDLRNFKFREHSSHDFLTMQTTFDFTEDDDVTSPIWEKFIDEVTEGDKDKADFLQRALGYSMLGMSNEECIFILHGKTTRNGKSTLLNTIETMLGTYAKVAPVGMICRGDRQKDAEAASPTLAGLKGKRFVTMAESNEYGKLDEEKIKQFTGGEEISARALYQSAITYKPQFTIWLSCNDLPAVTDKSLFASERIRVIEFNRHFSQAEQDKHLKDKLLSPDSMKGIFMWLIRGYKRYKKRGLSMTEKLQQVTREYEKDNDIVLQFLDARCEKQENGSVRLKDLYTTFKMWAKSDGYRILTLKKFTSELDRHADWYSEVYFPSNKKTYKGLKIRESI